jgi:hypothetical protein
MQCCKSPQIKDLSQGLSDERHYYCSACKSHLWRGVQYDRREWEDYVNEVPMRAKVAHTAN